MIGKSISHYEILEKLGQGGMGIVYKAHDTRLDRIVALKFLPSDIIASDADKQRFIREAKAAAALNHPNICTIYSVEEHNGHQFISMEYVDGVNLREQSAGRGRTSELRGQTSEAEERETLSLKHENAIDYAIQIAEALSEAHEKGIVHRDIKPDNIMVDSKNRIKVMDFGLAKFKGSINLTKSGGTIGTIQYMSPEQIQGAEIDHRSDIFSFGIVFYELLTGHTPFRGEHEAAIVYSIVNDDPHPLSYYLPEVSPGMQRMVMRTLEKDKNKRYQSLHDVLTELRLLKNETSTTITQPSFGDSAPADNNKRTIPHQVSDRIKPLRIGIVIAVIIFIAVILYFLIPKQAEYGSNAVTGRIAIAVLPFENLSPDPDNEYFTDGITEDIIIQLSKISNLRVMSRSSMMSYKGSVKTIREIGNELGVGILLEGSVRRVGNQVRINSQLIDIHTNESVWGETYDRTIEDIFKIQADVATQIASALQITLSPEEKRYIERQPTENLEAYDYYLRGREFYLRYRREHNENAIEYFMKAIETDPEFALPYAGLGDAYGQRVIRFDYAADWADSSISASERAIQLDPGGAEGYKALALAYLAKGKYQKAREQNLHAIQLSTNYDIAHLNLGLLHLHNGDFKNAFQRLSQSFELRAPTDPWPYHGLGILQLYLDNIGDADRNFRQSLHYSPDFTSPRIALAIGLILTDRVAEARKESDFLLQLDPENVSFIHLKAFIETIDNNYNDALRLYAKSNQPYSGRIVLGSTKFSTPGSSYIYLKTGDAVQFENSVRLRIMNAQRIIDSGHEHYIYPYELATSYAMLNDAEKAIHYLEQAISSGWRLYHFAMIDPSFDTVRHNIRFRRIIENVKSMVESEKKVLTAVDK
jgi:serine/threonine protein kinase/tetratricopeptide (TPR) repeat protein